MHYKKKSNFPNQANQIPILVITIIILIFLIIIISFKIFFQKPTAQIPETFYQEFSSDNNNSYLFSNKISNVIAQKITNQSAQILWQTESTSSSEIIIGPSQDNLDQIIPLASPSQIHSLEIDNLESKKRYFFRLRAKNQNQVTESDIYNFKTK